jgi:hypothetical protein
MARSLKERKETAIEAVVRQFLASDHAKVEVVTVAVGAKVSRRSSVKAPRLRFDRVVLSLFGRLREALQSGIPKGVTVVVTVTAPIRLASKTAVALEESIRALVGKRSTRRRLEGTIHGNEIQIRVMKSAAKTSTSNFAGFVHNRDSDPGVLFEMVDSLLRGLAVVKRGRTRRSGERWLVVAIEGAPTLLETYRRVCEQLFAGADFQRIVLVHADGRVVT